VGAFVSSVGVSAPASLASFCAHAFSKLKETIRSDRMIFGLSMISVFLWQRFVPSSFGEAQQMEIQSAIANVKQCKGSVKMIQCPIS